MIRDSNKFARYTVYICKLHNDFYERHHLRNRLFYSSTYVVPVGRFFFPLICRVVTRETDDSIDSATFFSALFFLFFSLLVSAAARRYCLLYILKTEFLRAYRRRRRTIRYQTESTPIHFRKWKMKKNISDDNESKRPMMRDYQLNLSRCVGIRRKILASTNPKPS